MGPLKTATSGAEQATTFYAKDLDALTEEQILGCAGGVARKPVDFTYEVAFINKRVAARLRGEEPPAWPATEGFLVAPDEFQSKSAILAYLAEASSELLEAANAIPEEEGGKLIGPEGKQEPAYAMVTFAAIHTMYHDAQLNFIQSLAGDGGMHWF
jgi:hypothetical protein